MARMIEVWHLWIIAGLVLWIIEIFTGGFVLGVFGTACLIVAPFAAANLPFKVLLLSFGVSAGGLSLGIRPLVVKHFYRRESDVLTNVDALIGKVCSVTEPIDHSSGTGTVKIDGESWRAVTPDESRIDIGSKVVVRAVEGCKVAVEVAIARNQCAACDRYRRLQMPFCGRCGNSLANDRSTL